VSDDRAALGRRGERIAARFLKRAGFKILAKNYRCPAGELDLIALDGVQIVFVEVKTRTGEQAEDVERAVHPRKQAKLLHVARYYLTAHPAAHDHPCRFDIVGIVAQDDGSHEIQHFPDAFTPAGRFR
jgi:putative endonuclease